MCFFVGGGPTQPGRGEYSISVERDKGKRRNMLTACLLKAKYCSRLNLTDDRGSKINRRSDRGIFLLLLVLQRIYY